MFVVDILFALVVAGLLTGLFYFGRSARAGRWAVSAAVMIGLAFALWLSGFWLGSAGKVVWVTHWFSYSFILLPATLLVVISLSRRAARSAAVAGYAQDTLGLTLFFSLSALLFVTLVALRFV